MQKLLRAVSEHDRGIAKKKEQLGKIASSQEGDIKEILLRIVSEVEELKSINRRFINRLEEQRTEIERLREELRKVKEEANIDPLIRVCATDGPSRGLFPSSSGTLKGHKRHLRAPCGR